jgi:hypothetical protein
MSTLLTIISLGDLQAFLILSLITICFLGGETEKDIFPDFSKRYFFELETMSSKGKFIKVYGQIIDVWEIHSNQQTVVFKGVIQKEDRLIGEVYTKDGTFFRRSSVEFQPTRSLDPKIARP